MEVICYSCGRGENPENTIEGIEHCLSINPNWRIEMDIQITSDGHLVLFHDYETKRITGEDKRIDKLTLEQVKELNAGFSFESNGSYIYRDSPIRIPTLIEVFERFKEAKLLLDLHSNDPKAVDKLIELIEEFKLEKNVVVVSHYDEVVRSFRKKRSSWVYGVPKMEAKKMIYSSFLKMDGLFPIKSNILMLPYKAGSIKVLKKRVIDHAHKRKKKLWAWMYEGEVVKNINNKADLNFMQGLGVDGVFTDCPMQLTKDLEKLNK